MYAIIGATGKVGYSTAFTLREAGLPVRAILRDASKAEPLQTLGCEIAIANLQDTTALASAIAGAQSVQVICPPAPRVADTVDDMHRSIGSIVAALDRARPQTVLAISDYGAHVREDIGMPTMFRVFEELLRQLPMQKILLRSAEHIEGWARMLPVALSKGVLPTLHGPVDKTFPSVSARDVGRIAADLLRSNDGAEERVVHAEGPRRVSAADIASTLSQLLGRAVEAQPLPRSEWAETLGRIMSPSAVDLLVKLYDAHHRGGLVEIEAGCGEVRHGNTDLYAALRPMVPAELKID